MMKLNSSGQSLFEVTVALGVMALVAIAVVSVVTLSVRNSNFSQNKTLADNYASEAVEWIRQQRDNAATWAAFLAYSNGTGLDYCFTTLTWNPGACGTEEKIGATPFYRNVTLTTVSNQVEAEVVVSWNDPKGYHESKLMTTFTNFQGN